MTVSKFSIFKKIKRWLCLRRGYPIKCYFTEEQYNYLLSFQRLLSNELNHYLVSDIVSMCVDSAMKAEIKVDFEDYDAY